MAYCLQADESIPDGVRRIAEEQLRLAAGHLRAGDNLEEQIHEARKNLKKARAVLRLVKRDLGPAYVEEEWRLRDVARRFSSLRDAHAALELLDDFAKKHRCKRRMADVRAELERNCRALESQPECAEFMKSASEELTAAQKRVENWPVRSPNLGAGLKSAYRRAAKAFSALKAAPTADHFHDLRKRIKTHLYQLRIVSRITGDVWRHRIRQFKALSDYLGEQHNFVILERALPQGGEEDAASAFILLAARQRQRLEARAMRLADGLFAAKSHIGGTRQQD